jgi:hypothetical protein
MQKKKKGERAIHAIQALTRSTTVLVVIANPLFPTKVF